MGAVPFQFNEDIDTAHCMLAVVQAVSLRSIEMIAAGTGRQPRQWRLLRSGRVRPESALMVQAGAATRGRATGQLSAQVFLSPATHGGRMLVLVL